MPEVRGQRSEVGGRSTDQAEGSSALRQHSRPASLKVGGPAGPTLSVTRVSAGRKPCRPHPSDRSTF